MVRGRQSKIWKRSSNGSYYTIFNGVQYNLGRDLGAAEIRFRQLTGDKQYQEVEPLITSLCEAANHIARYMEKEEAIALITAVYAMREKTKEGD